MRRRPWHFPRSIATHVQQVSLPRGQSVLSRIYCCCACFGALPVLSGKNNNTEDSDRMLQKVKKYTAEQICSREERGTQARRGDLGFAPTELLVGPWPVQPRPDLQERRVKTKTCCSDGATLPVLVLVAHITEEQQNVALWEGDFGLGCASRGVLSGPARLSPERLDFSLCKKCRECRAKTTVANDASVWCRFHLVLYYCSHPPV